MMNVDLWAEIQLKDKTTQDMIINMMNEEDYQDYIILDLTIKSTINPNKKGWVVVDNVVREILR